MFACISNCFYAKNQVIDCETKLSKNELNQVDNNDIIINDEYTEIPEKTKNEEIDFFNVKEKIHPEPHPRCKEYYNLIHVQ